MSTRKVDIYNHVLPRRFAEQLREAAPTATGMLKRTAAIPMLQDIEARVRMMDQWPGYQQVLTIANPPVETLVGPSDSPELVRLGNDELKAICDARPDKFPAWVASLPMNNIPAALEEMERAVALGARGVQVFTNVDGKPLDRPEYWPIFEEATRRWRIGIWMHPARDARRPDYADEETSAYEIWQVLGWPYETSVAMSRMVFSGFFDRLPDLRIITHHLGAMIPYFEGRVGPLWDQLGTRTVGELGDEYRRILEAMRANGRRPIDYFRLFYNDTAVGGSASAIRCGLDFFGPERVLFASDCPFDPEGGPMFIRETIRVLDKLEMSDADREAIYSGNALRLLGMTTESDGHVHNPAGGCC